MNATRKAITGLLASVIAVPAAIAVATTADAATTTVTNSLQAMVVEEKLAHDVYVTLSESYSVRILQNISYSESQHLDALRVLLNRYGIKDPTIDDAVGEFDDPAVQALYNRLVARGQKSFSEGMKVGVKIEKIDIADLNENLAKSLPSDIDNVLLNLRSGSQRHLTAFNRML